jgi:hypothetical protein
LLYFFKLEPLFPLLAKPAKDSMSLYAEIAVTSFTAWTFAVSITPVHDALNVGTVTTLTYECNLSFVACAACLL